MSTIYFNLIKQLSFANKYTRWYIAICSRALIRGSISQYTENHHILPRSFKLGGETDSSNLVQLTFREHFIVHLLLTKMLTDKKLAAKMKFAMTCFAMVNPSLITDRKVTSRIFEIAHKSRSMPCTEERRLSISNARKNTGKVCCIYCKKETDPANHGRFHGKNCKHGPNSVAIVQQRNEQGKASMQKSVDNGNYKPPEKPKGPFTCPHCSKVGTNNGSMKRFHFENCTSHPSGGKIRIPLPNRKVSCLDCKQETDLANFSKSHGVKCQLS